MRKLYLREAKAEGSWAEPLYDLMEGDTAVGQGSLELKEGRGRIGYSLLPERRGCGYEKEFFALLLTRALKELPDCPVFYTEVPDNDVASQKILEDFMFVKQEAEKETKSLTYVIDREALSELPALDGVTIESMEGGILLLSNNRNSLALYEWLKGNCTKVLFYSGKLSKEQLCYLKPRLTISYNYAYIVAEEMIALLQGKIINMHISYLPWNRGSDPNFWSFIEDTPKGVTIHLLEKGLDTGKIIVQKECFFDETKETFTSVYEKLNDEILELLKRNWQHILSWDFKAYQQQGKGTYHTRKERMTKFPPVSWTELISDYKKRICNEPAFGTTTEANKG